MCERISVTAQTARCLLRQLDALVLPRHGSAAGGTCGAQSADASFVPALGRLLVQCGGAGVD